MHTRFSSALGENHPLRQLAVRDVVALALLTLFTLLLFGLTGIYFGAYSRYRASLGLPTDNTPVITLPVVRRH